MKDMNIQALRAKEKKHISVVLSIDEVKQIIANVNGIYQVMLKLCTPRAFPPFSQGIWLWFTNE